MGGFRYRVRQLQTRAAEQEAFARQLIASQENERGRIAAELHDGLSRSLVIIKNRAMLSLLEPDDHDRAIEVPLRKGAQQVELLIRDNGKGFSLDAIKQDAQRKGNRHGRTGQVAGWTNAA